MPAPTTSNTPATDLVAAFKRYGIFAIMVPAVVVAILVGTLVYQVIITDFGGVFAGGMNGIVSEAYTRQDFVAGERNDSFAALQTLVDERVKSGRLSALRVQDLQGTVIFSTDRDEIGTVVPLSDDARKALERDEPVSGVVTSDALLPAGSGRVLRVTHPARVGSGPPLGVITSFKPYSTVQPSVNRSVATVVVTVLVGALAAYFLLWMLVARAERELKTSAEQVAVLNARLGGSLNEMERHFLGTLQALNAAVDAKDRYTALHSLHVADYACALGMKLGLEDEITSLERAGLLHDVGKIGVVEVVLKKPSGLTEAEYEIVKEHSRVGATMIETLPFLHEVVPVIMHHHERWDGRGYPDGLAGDRIPRLARILAVADAFDAMTTSRPYRSAIGVSAARTELIRGRGTQFDPEMVDAFVELIDDGTIVVRDVRITA